MSNHRGKTLKAQVEKKGLGFDFVAKSIGVDRSSIYRWFKDPKLDWDKVLLVCKHLELNPTALFEDFPTILNATKSDSLELTQQKLIDALEKVADLQEIVNFQKDELRNLQAELERVKNGSK